MDLINNFFELAAKHGIGFMTGMAILFIAIQVIPKIVDIIAKKKEAELEKETHDAAFLVFGVDKNQELWLCASFRTKEEAKNHIELIKPMTIDNEANPIHTLIYVECEFGKSVDNLQSYRPYCQIHFEDAGELTISAGEGAECAVVCHVGEPTHRP